jgi:hypothetical protein
MEALNATPPSCPTAALTLMLALTLELTLALTLTLSNPLLSPRLRRVLQWDDPRLVGPAFLLSRKVDAGIDQPLAPATVE